MIDDARSILADAIGRLRDRRRTVRREAEEVFDRQTFVTILFLAPAGKAIELLVFGRPGMAARFAALALAGLLIGIYWKRLAERASDAADAVEDAIEE